MVTGYILVFLLAFGLGRITILLPHPPEIRVEEPDALQVNNSAEVQGAQSQQSIGEVRPVVSEQSPTSFAPVNGDCRGKIKGSSGKIYHVPGGAFYDRTIKPQLCFETETAAAAAGFRKSVR